MSEAALKEHLESLYDAFLNTGEEAKAKEFAAYVRYPFNQNLKSYDDL